MTIFCCHATGGNSVIAYADPRACGVTRMRRVVTGHETDEARFLNDCAPAVEARFVYLEVPPQSVMLSGNC